MGTRSQNQADYGLDKSWIHRGYTYAANSRCMGELTLHISSEFYQNELSRSTKFYSINSSTMSKQVDLNAHR